MKRRSILTWGLAGMLAMAAGLTTVGIAGEFSSDREGNAAGAQYQPPGCPRGEGGERGCERNPCARPRTREDRRRCSGRRGVQRDSRQGDGGSSDGRSSGGGSSAGGALAPGVQGGDGRSAGGGVPAPGAQIARVSEIIDGDTLLVRLPNGETRVVRLIGIDAPESGGAGGPAECGGPQARAFMERQAMERRGSSPLGHEVWLIADPSQPEADDEGRVLAYVERLSDGIDLGELMVSAGWAQALDGTFERSAIYDDAESRAESGNDGVWARCDGDFDRAR